MSQRRGRRSSPRRVLFPAQEHKSCELCHGCHTHTSSPNQWNSSQAREFEKSLGVCEDGVVCRPCRKDVSKTVADPSHIPAVHDQFQRYVNELAAASHLEGDNVVKLVPSTWLLSGLTANLKHHITYSCKVHIAYSCKVRKYGTMHTLQTQCRPTSLNSESHVEGSSSRTG